MSRTFQRPALIKVSGNRLTDHNRSELGVDVERIETRNRMANGLMRKYYVADKRTFTVSWSDTPKMGTQTVDGFWSGQEIKNFYESAEGRGSFPITITDNKRVESAPITVVITGFNYSVKKRWENWELWDFSLTLEEV